ncbi:hypothetical protein GUA87_06160 [Sneathiella sp. P13V-1]|uniref:hypothetical protein n=1 Tax=Sneathiella sp. P13V-1 TaxID=2697366 RepID=UPI00187B4C17|nr:hypothetical protein [Sneathiella sp. P13V-1]MBE7636422.1 hypothetical protein [Sneathiella sp. P13V-1]
MPNTGLGLYFSRPLMQRSLMVAVIAGTLLCLINQWQGLTGEAPIDWPKIALTYCVPFLVSSISAYLTVRSQILKTMEAQGRQEL